MNSKHLSPQEIQPTVNHFVKDQQVRQLLRTQLSSLPQHLNIALTYDQIYILINTSNLQPMKQKEPIESIYAIKISKSFPLAHSLKIHLLHGALQPRISDCRDLFEDIMGKPYNYSIHLSELLDPILKFDELLHHKNELFLEMQRIGRFTLGETFYYHELIQNFPSMSLLKDLSQKKKNGLYVAITDTHLLILKESGKPHQKGHLKHASTITNEKDKQSVSQQTYDKLVMIVSSQLQCIESLWYLPTQNIIRLVFKKYKSIKSYYQPEEIKRSFVFNEPEIFLRGVLKYISKFQQSQISFQAGISALKPKKRKSQLSSTQKQSEYIYLLIEQANSLQQKCKKENIQGQMKQKVQQLIKIYQKIIQFYSARANPYYLIYVSKLNQLYKQFYVNKTIGHGSSIMKTT